MHLLLSAALVAQFTLGQSLEFERVFIADTRYEAAGVCDVNQDGHPDIVCGAYWYAGPDFKNRVFIADLEPFDDYFDDFSNYPMDMNGDGLMDIVSGGWFLRMLRWRENPGENGVPWKTHIIDTFGNVERPCFWDLDGDGQIDFVPNSPGAPYLAFRIKQQRGGPAEFEKHILHENKQGHGLGCGDINGDGRLDLVGADGWLEAPADTWTGEWTWHALPSLGQASVPTLVYDVNEDGRNDIIVGQGHDYGLAWWEQTGAPDDIQWTKHDIDTANSQFHAADLVDLDGDGTPELITGKRYHAHSGHDPGAEDPIGLYYYEIDKGKFTRHVIDRGAAGAASGTGIYFWVEDLNNDHLPDIVAPGKEGLYLFLNRGPVSR